MKAILENSEFRSFYHMSDSGSNGCFHALNDVAERFGYYLCDKEQNMHMIRHYNALKYTHVFMMKRRSVNFISDNFTRF